MSIEEIRNHFPQLSDKVYGRPLVYLDNAATSLRPKEVIDKWIELSEHFNSNIHRAVHYTADNATALFEETRKTVADFIGAPDSGNIIFTSGATASLNLLASSLSESFLQEGDEIIISESEHHSDIVPWQLRAASKGVKIKILPVDDNGCLKIDLLPELISYGKTKMICVAHISNVLGIINPIKEICSLAHEKGCAVVVDGSQGIIHCPVNVQDLDCDFYVFSGHKIYATTGTGVLYSKKKWIDSMPPYMGGGEMIETVRFSGSSFTLGPQKFEAGTQNFNGIPTFIPAIKLSKELRENNLGQIKACVLSFFDSNQDIYTLYGKPEDLSTKVELFSFCVKGVHHEDLALLLDKMGIAVRSGQMCAEPLMDRFGVTGMLRASFAPYNTIEEAEYFLSSLKKAVKMLRCSE